MRPKTSRAKTRTGGLRRADKAAGACGTGFPKLSRLAPAPQNSLRSLGESSAQTAAASMRTMRALRRAQDGTSQAP